MGRSSTCHASANWSVVEYDYRLSFCRQEVSGGHAGDFSADDTDVRRYAFSERGFEWHFGRGHPYRFGLLAMLMRFFTRFFDWFTHKSSNCTWLGKDLKIRNDVVLRYGKTLACLHSRPLKASIESVQCLLANEVPNAKLKVQSPRSKVRY